MSETKETIQSRLLSNINDEYDKTEGSFFYDVEMPVAIELETAYSNQDVIMDRGFADTAIDIYLDKIVSEQGIVRKAATYATTTVTITGTEGSIISIGDKVSSDIVNFISLEDKVIDITGIATVNVICEVSGNTGNVPVATIKYFPVTIPGLISVTNNVTVTNGYNAESDAELRTRYYTKVQTPSTSGNKYHYINWAKEVTGVGDAKVFPLWNGNGTVKVVIINSNKVGADGTLITNVETYIEENRPIGATVTVVSATELPININVTLVIDTNNYDLATITASIQSNLILYLQSIAFVTAYVSYASIGNTIYNTPGITDYSGLLVNGDNLNIIVADTEVAVLGGVVIG